MIKNAYIKIIKNQKKSKKVDVYCLTIIWIMLPSINTIFMHTISHKVHTKL